ncbi:MAG: hypothetical protein N2204_06535 [Anaerolineae bacterium]|nr:hypothetical protein [Anaerolineae bacterium]
MLELPIAAGSDVTAQLRFLDTTDALIVELEAPRPSGLARLRRFDLRSVRDALRMSSSPAIRVELQVGGLPVRDRLALTILTIRRSIAVERADVVLRKRDGNRYVEIAWEPEIPLRWRQVRLWSLTRPWTEPITVPIPDSAQGKHVFPVEAEAMPAGRYLIEFLVSDPWLPETAPTRPQSDAPNVKSAMIGSLEERLAELEAARQEGGNPFSCACESVFLWEALGQVDRTAESLNRCWEYRHAAASLRQMMALAHAFRGQPTGKAFMMKLYATEQIKQVLAAYRDGKLPETVLNEYLGGLPPLQKLAPPAVEALLEAPDARVQFAAARYLIEWGKDTGITGIKAALAWEASGRLSRQGLDELLGLNLPLAVEFISPEQSIRLLQTSDSRDVQLALATNLIRRDQPEGVLAVLRLCERRAIPDAQAVAALGVNSRFAARLLSEQSANKVAASLLAQLLEVYPDAIPLVRAGVWVGSNLGWARINGILSSDGRRIESLPPDQVERGIILDVVFQPGADAIQALIDVEHRRVVLQGAARVYQCAKCNRYIALHPDKITGEHERTAHEGMHPALRPLDTPIPLVGHLEFRHKAPA